MGFLSDLLDRGGDLGGALRTGGRGAFSNLIQPIGRGIFDRGLKPIGRGARSAFRTYERQVQDPFSFQFLTAVEQPKAFFKEEGRKVLQDTVLSRLLGGDDLLLGGPGAARPTSRLDMGNVRDRNLLGQRASLGDEEAQDTLRTELETKSVLTQLGLEFIDPLLFLGVGATVTKIPKAFVIGTQSAGKLGALRNVSGLVIKEAAYGTMVPQLTRGLINTAKAPWALARAGKLSAAKRILNSWEMARTASYDALDNLTQAQKEKFLRVEMLLVRGATDPDIAKDPKKLGAIFRAIDKRFKRFTGNKFAVMDMQGQVRKNSITAMAGDLVDIDSEMKNLSPLMLPEAILFERIFQKIPFVRRILSGLDPTVRFKKGIDTGDAMMQAADAFVYSFVQAGNKIEDMADYRSLVLGSGRGARDFNVGSIQDVIPKVTAKGPERAYRVVRGSGGVTFRGDDAFQQATAYARRLGGVVKDVSKPGTSMKNTWTNIFRYPDKFNLTDAQFDIIIGFHGANRKIAGKIKGMYQRAIAAGTFKPTASQKRWLALLDTEDPKGGFFVPRIARFVAPDGMTVAEVAAEVGDRSRFLWRTVDGISTPRIPLLGRFFSRGPRGLAPTKKASRALGATQPQELLQVDDPVEGIMYATNPGEIAAGYARGLLRVAKDDLIYEPIAKTFKIPFSKIVAGEVVANAVQATKARNRLVKLRDLARVIHRTGGARATTLSGIRQSRESGAFTDDVARIILDLEDAVNDYVSVAGDLPRAVIRSGKQTARTLRVYEGKELSVAQAQAVRKTVAKGAQASLTAGESVTAKKRLTTVSKRVADALTPIVNQARIDANEAKAIVRLTQKSLPMSSLRRAVHTVPGLQGGLFDNKLADLFDRELGSGTTQLEGAGILLTGVNAFIQGIQTGFDASVILIQTLSLAPSNPAMFAKAAAMGIGEMFGMDNYAGYMRGLSKQIDPASGKSMFQLIQESGLGISSSEFFSPAQALVNLRAMDTPIGGILNTMGDLPWNRGWGAGRNIAAIEMFKAQLGLEQALLGRMVTSDELRAIARQVDMATGVVDSSKLGIRTLQASGERMFGRFGAQWFRSQTGRLIQAANAGMDGRLARRILFQQVGAMVIAYAAVSYALGQEPEFDPRAGGRFFTVEHNGQRYGISTPFRGIVKLIAETFTGHPNRFLTVSGGKNPLFRFWKNGSPMIGKLIADTALKIKDPNERFTVFDEGWGNVLPFVGKDILEAPGGLEDKVTTGAISGLGATVFPESDFTLFNTMANERARAAGFRDWDEVPAATKKDMLDADAELKEASDASKKFNQQFPDPDDHAFEIVRNGRLAMEHILTPLWARVQSGEMSKSDWRQQFSEMTRVQAGLSKAALGGIDEAKRNKNEPLQDQLARLFQSIQPEMFDANGDGIPDIDEGGPEAELAWDAWREARRQFYEVYPEALEFKEYIEVAYPSRVYDDPLLRQAVVEKRQAQSSYDYFLSLPKYRGLSVEEGRFIDDVIGLASRASREIQFMAAQRGQDISVPKQVAWRYALQQIRASGRQLTPNESRLMSLAIRMDTVQDGRRRMLSFQRARFITDNPLMVEWYPSALQAAGLRDEDIARLGISDQPLGDPISARIGVASARLTDPLTIPDIGVSLGV